jgi:UDP-N-acetylmuramate--alanine ligase
MKTINLNEIQKVHFIGIGGIGISAIARMFLLEGKTVSGSDQSSSLATKELEKFGAKINFQQVADNIPADCQLVIYTKAIADDNPELVAAKAMGVPVLTYPQALGLVSAAKYTVAVAGTHGKTTTTAMLAQIAMAANLDPTVIVGSFLLSPGKETRTNFIAGRSNLFIAEACEYKRSFLDLTPAIVVITNIDADHLDYYKDLEAIQTAFAELVAKIPVEGFLVCNPGDPKLKPVLAAVKCQIVDYSTVTPEGLKLLAPGEHNRLDALAALAVVKILKIEMPKAIEALNKFPGTWRRFEYKGQLPQGTKVYDDYAHHPTEIAATLAGARELMKSSADYQSGRLIVAFQPHLYSRTKALMTDFATALSAADLVLITKIYAAREAFDETVRESDLVDQIKQKNRLAVFVPTLVELKSILLAEAKPNDLLIVMGAGDIYTVAESLLAPGA